MNSNSSKILTYASGAAGVLFIISLYFTLFYAPTEVNLGQAQRIFYQHVSISWLYAATLFVTMVAGILYLITRNDWWDRLALSCAEIGTIFTILSIISGSIWAKPSWGDWWTWDPRLISATITTLLYIGYLMLRQGIEAPERRAVFAGVYGIVAYVSVPLTIFSIRIWRTIHPVVIGSGDPTADGSFNMTPEMRTTLFVNLILFSLISIVLIWHRFRLENAKARVEQLKIQVLTEQP
jgi:heme exporter protein C